MTLYRIHKHEGSVSVLDLDGWNSITGTIEEVLPPSFKEHAKPKELGGTDTYRYLVTEEP